MSKAFLADSISLGPNVLLLQGAVAPNSGGGQVAPVGSYFWQTSTFTMWQKVGSGNTAWVSLLPQDLFGDASDSALVVGAGTTTITRDTYYSNLTIQNAGILVPRGIRIFVQGTLTIDAGGSILSDGAAGTAAGAAGAGAPGSIGNVIAAGFAGGAGGAAAGSAGSSSGSCIQGFNGVGGAGGAGSLGAGGAAGTITVQGATTQGNPRSLVQAGIGEHAGGSAVARITVGSGGGGGGGDGTAGGGGGGGGGGIVILARSIINNGTIGARGGAGGAPAAGTRGGGGGGGGGLVVLGFHAFTGAAPSVAGGLGGAGSGGQPAGGDGSPGLYVPIQI